MYPVPGMVVIFGPSSHLLHLQTPVEPRVLSRYALNTNHRQTSATRDQALHNCPA